MRAFVSLRRASVCLLPIAALASSPALADLQVDQDLGTMSVPLSRALFNQEFDPARNTEAQHYLVPNFYPGNPVYNFARLYRLELTGPARVITQSLDANGRAHGYLLTSLSVSGGLATGTLPQVTQRHTLVPSGGVYYAAFANDGISNPGPYPTIDPVAGSNLRFGAAVTTLPYIPQVAQTTVTLNAASPTIIKTTHPNDPDLDTFTSRYAVVPFWIEPGSSPGLNSFVDFLFDRGLQWGIYTSFNPSDPTANTFGLQDFWLSGGNRSLLLPQGMQFYAVLYSPVSSGDVSFDLQMGNAAAGTHIGIIPAPGAAGLLLLAGPCCLARRRRRGCGGPAIAG